MITRKEFDPVDKGAEKMKKMVAAIILLVVAIGAFIALTPGPLMAFLGIENATDGGMSIEILHKGGGQISAVDTSMEVWVNGVPQSSTFTLSPETNDKNFELDEAINVSFTTPLQTGDIIAVVYKPTNQVVLTEIVA